MTAADFRPRPLPLQPAPCVRGRGVVPKEPPVTDRGSSGSSSILLRDHTTEPLQDRPGEEKLVNLTLSYKQSPLL